MIGHGGRIYPDPTTQKEAMAILDDWREIMGFRYKHQFTDKIGVCSSYYAHLSSGKILLGEFFMDKLEAAFPEEDFDYLYQSIRKAA